MTKCLEQGHNFIQIMKTFSSYCTFQKVLLSIVFRFYNIFERIAFFKLLLTKNVVIGNKTSLLLQKKHNLNNETQSKHALIKSKHFISAI